MSQVPHSLASLFANDHRRSPRPFGAPVRRRRNRGTCVSVERDWPTRRRGNRPAARRALAAGSLRLGLMRLVAPRSRAAVCQAHSGRDDQLRGRRHKPRRTGRPCCSNRRQTCSANRQKTRCRDTRAGRADNRTAPSPPERKRRELVRTQKTHFGINAKIPADERDNDHHADAETARAARHTARCATLAIIFDISTAAEIISAHSKTHLPASDDARAILYASERSIISL